MSYKSSMMFLQKLYNWWYSKHPPEMVSWWMKSESISAKVTTDTDGSYIMWMKGEKYPFPGYPRGHLLYGVLSPLKHEIKNKVFNDTWHRLDAAKEPLEQIASGLTGPIFETILSWFPKIKYDMIPIEHMSPVVREIHRAWSVISKDQKMAQLRDIICFILQEDDAYRFRLQWIAPFLVKRDIRCSFSNAMHMLENAEITDDMKDRARLIKRIILFMMPHVPFIEAFFQELDLKKMSLSKADKYFFRAKYFKVDYPKYQY